MTTASLPSLGERTMAAPEDLGCDGAAIPAILMTPAIRSYSSIPCGSCYRRRLTLLLHEHL
jgi:hypothetical protein